MQVFEWTTPARGSIRHLAIPIVGAVALTVIARWLQLPLFVFDDASVMLVVAIAVRWGLGAAIAGAFSSAIAAKVMLAATSPQLPRTLGEDIADLAMLVGIAIVVNRLVTQARQAQEAAERGAARERQVRQQRERVVATVAHDLATPLTAVSGTLRFAKRFGLAQDSDDRRVLRRLETATARAESLVRTLTDIGDRGSVRPERMQIADLREIVRPIAEMMEPVSARHPIALTLGDTPLPIDADVERLQRVFENLLNNAIKYSPAGGLIEVAVRSDRDEAVAVVRDHGIGIAADVGSRIFDLAYRAPQAAEMTAGHGLGLHIAAQIVAAHGGCIDARPAPGGGTAVLVRLPLAPVTEAGTRLEIGGLR